MGRWRTLQIKVWLKRPFAELINRGAGIKGVIVENDIPSLCVADVRCKHVIPFRTKTFIEIMLRLQIIDNLVMSQPYGITTQIVWHINSYVQQPKCAVEKWKSTIATIPAGNPPNLGYSWLRKAPAVLHMLLKDLLVSEEWLKFTLTMNFLQRGCWPTATSIDTTANPQLY